MKLLTTAFWASWFAMEWCGVFHIGDPDVLVKMFWTHLVSAILCSILCFIRWSWDETERKQQSRIKSMPPRVTKND